MPDMPATTPPTYHRFRRADGTYPPMAGGAGPVPGTPAGDPPAPAPTATPPAPAPTPAPAPAPPGGQPPVDPALLAQAQNPDAVQRAIQAERDARAAAERQLREAQEERDRLRQAAESDQQRQAREAEEGRRLAQEGRDALRRANLQLALSARGLPAQRTLAASRLLDGVEFDANHQPTNLDARITAATAVYGAEQFAGATPAPTPAAPGAPTPTPPVPPDPSAPHAGAQPPANEPSEEEAFNQFMRENFPGAVPPPAPAAAPAT
jgi:translation initiation factor IF-2